VSFRPSYWFCRWLFSIISSKLQNNYAKIHQQIFPNRSIQCRRLTIHKHLAFSFVLRFLATICWSIFKVHYQAFDSCGSAPYVRLWNIEIILWKFLKIKQWICKCILFMLMYAAMAGAFWMFLEVRLFFDYLLLKTMFQGAYLVSRFTIFAMRSSEVSVFFYHLIGWGIDFYALKPKNRWFQNIFPVLPFLFVVSWAVPLEMDVELRRNCWVPYSNNPFFIYLIVMPNTAAFGVNNLMSFKFF